MARYLAHITRYGWVILRTAALAERLQLERSEAYRVLNRLRALGLYGISNDRGGHAGGRRIWRTAVRRRGSELDAGRHHAAWARVVGKGKHARAAAMDRLASLRGAGRRTGAVGNAAPSGAPLPAPRPFPLRQLLWQHAPGLASEWRVSRETP